jgi:hypothetical protein
MVRRAVVIAVVEDAADAQAGVALRLQRLDQFLAGRPAADDRHAALKPAHPGEAQHDERDRQAFGEQQHEPDGIEGGEPDARDLVADLEEEEAGQRQQEQHRPAGSEPYRHGDEVAQRAEMIEVQRLEDGEPADRHQRHGDLIGQGVVDLAGDIEGEDHPADGEDHQHVGEAHQPLDQHRRQCLLDRHGGDALGQRVEGPGRTGIPARRSRAGRIRLDQVANVESAHLVQSSRAATGTPAAQKAIST